MITVDQIMAKHPCARYDRTSVEGLVGAGATIQDIKDAPIPPQDKLWMVVVFLMDANQRGLFMCDCAEQALSLLSSPDPRSVSALEIARQYLAGTATKPELVGARIEANAAGFRPVFAAIDAIIHRAHKPTFTVTDSATSVGVTLEWQLTRALTIIGAVSPKSVLLQR